jgi:hypothetical protein
MSLPNEVNLQHLGGTASYNLTNSLRFRGIDGTHYLSRTLTQTGSQTKFTLSVWVKKSNYVGSMIVPMIQGTNSDYTVGDFNLGFRDGDGFFGNYYTGVNNFIFDSNAKLRDSASWYHLVYAFDTTQATDTNRIKVYLNGVQVTFSAVTYPSLNYNIPFLNNGYQLRIGISSAAPYGRYYDGYMAEYNFIDGQQLTPSSFGETDSTTGVWKPKKYTGTYGANGFYLNFSNTTSTTTLCYDSSGNGNHWTPNGISLTAGPTYDSMTDVPTMSATASNYCTWSSADNAGGAVTANTGGLEATRTSSTNSWAAARGTMYVSSGKWYYEMTSGMPAAGFYSMGVSNSSFDTTTDPKGSSNAWVVYLYDGTKYNGSSTAYGSGAAATTDVFQCAFDLDNGKIWWGKNGTWFASGDPASGANSAFTNLTSQSVAPIAGVYGNSSSGGAIANFGQRPFSYTPPTGFKSLNTYNLPSPSIVKPNKHMDATLYTGNGSYPRSITGLSFQPDLVWTKARSTIHYHALIDSVRGAGTLALSTNTTGNQTDLAVYANLTSFNSDGYTIGSTSSTNILNDNAQTFVGWQWNAGGANTTNTSGTITSLVRANQTAGFSILTYTGTGATGGTVGHGLGVAPGFIVTKSRTTAGYGWLAYHSSLGKNYYTQLNDTGAAGNLANVWGSGGVTSSVFGLYAADGSSNNVLNEPMLAYCWAPIAGYSAFGSYTGNGSTDGPFVYTGFRPKWLMIKRTDAARNWYVYDSSRDTYNVTLNELEPNLTNAEAVSAGSLGLDLLSSGFKFRTNQSAYNESTATYIYMAFAENPFKYALAR